MAPNPLNIFSPNRWFSRKNGGQAKESFYEHHDSPVPGQYHYVPGKGYYLVVCDSAPNTPLSVPIPVVYSNVLGKFLFTDDYLERKVFGTYEKTAIVNPDGTKVPRNSSYGSLAGLSAAAGSPTQQGQPSLPAVSRKRVTLNAYFFRVAENVYIRAYNEDGSLLARASNDQYRMVVKENTPVPQFKKIRRTGLNSTAASSRVNILFPGASTSGSIHPFPIGPPRRSDFPATCPQTPRTSCDEEPAHAHAICAAPPGRRLVKSLSLPDMSPFTHEKKQAQQKELPAVAIFSRSSAEVKKDKGKEPAERVPVPSPPPCSISASIHAESSNRRSSETLFRMLPGTGPAQAKTWPPATASPSSYNTSQLSTPASEKTQASTPSRRPKLVVAAGAATAPAAVAAPLPHGKRGLSLFPTMADQLRRKLDALKKRTDALHPVSRAASPVVRVRH